MNKTALTLLLIPLTLLALSPTVTAEEKEATPTGIIPGPPEESPLQVKLRTSKSRYSPGAEIKINYELNKKAYLYIYSIDARGKVNLLFPNRYDRDNHLEAGEGKLPGKGYSFLAGKKQGGEYIQAIASRKPLKLFSSIDSEKFEENPFPLISSKPKEFATTGTSMIESDVTSSDWATSWTSIEVTKKLSDLTVNSTPPNAEIYADGEVIGRTPLTFSVVPGETELELKLQGYEPWSGTVSTVPYGKKKIKAELSPTAVSWLKIESNPTGADVYIDGTFKGQTPIRVTVDSGERRVVLQKDGYENWKKKLKVEPYLTNKLDADLVQIVSSKIFITSEPTGAKIFIDGEYRGRTPRELVVNKEDIRLVLRKEGYRQWESEIKTPGTVRASLSEIRASGKPKEAGGVPLALMLNGGGFRTDLSLGAEVGISRFIVGGSFRNTGSTELPDTINWVQKPAGEEGEIRNYGPEWEAYLGYRVELPLQFYARLGAGVSFQPQANLIPLDSAGGETFNPLAEVARDAYFTFAAEPTFQAGLGVSTNGYGLDLSYHSRRGIVLGFGYIF